MNQLSHPSLNHIIDQARRNEEILKRLDGVEEFLLSAGGLDTLLSGLCAKISAIYGLEAVTLALAGDNQRLGHCVATPPAGCLWVERNDVRLLLGDMERPFLSNRLSSDLKSQFFPGGPQLRSAAVVPLWVRGQWLGALCMGSADGSRYTPDLDTHFIRRLGSKLAVGLETALVMAEAGELQRRQAAVEMAGAACHELAQPLTTVGLILEKVLRRLPDTEGLRESLDQALAQVDRASELLQRISEVNQYVTKPYAMGMNIIDVNAARDSHDLGAAGGGGKR